MNRVLIVAEHADGKLNASVAKCVACASAIPDAEIAVAVLAKDGTAPAAAAAGTCGRAAGAEASAASRVAPEGSAAGVARSADSAAARAAAVAAAVAGRVRSAGCAP